MPSWIEPYDGARHPDVGHPRDYGSEADVMDPPDSYDEQLERSPLIAWPRGEDQ